MSMLSSLEKISSIFVHDKHLPFIADEFIKRLFRKLMKIQINPFKIGGSFSLSWLLPFRILLSLSPKNNIFMDAIQFENG